MSTQQLLKRVETLGWMLTIVMLSSVCNYIYIYIYIYIYMCVCVCPHPHTYSSFADIMSRVRWPLSSIAIHQSTQLSVSISFSGSLLTMVHVVVTQDTISKGKSHDSRSTVIVRCPRYFYRKVYSH